jgi:cysteine desulfurase
MHRVFLGNPSSLHLFGIQARRLLGQARRNVAQIAGVRPEEISFVPSVSIGLNIAIQGLIGKKLKAPQRIGCSRLEHKSVLAIISSACARGGAEWIEIAVDRYGLLLIDSIAEAVSKGVDIVVVGHGNGEIGSVNDLGPIIQAVAGCSSLVIDVSQTAAYLDISEASCAACAIISGHKLYGPRGMAALYKRRDVELAPILLGAGQEHGLVPGTEDVPSIVALGIAARLALREREARRVHIEMLSSLFREVLLASVPEVEFNGHPQNCLPGHLSVTVPAVPAELLMRRLPDLAFSMGSACAGASESHVLRALGFSRARITRTFRVGFNVYNTRDEAERAAEEIGKAVLSMRNVT